AAEGRTLGGCPWRRGGRRRGRRVPARPGDGAAGRAVTRAGRRADGGHVGPEPGSDRRRPPYNGESREIYVGRGSL
ncbi:MAG: hypothetical protein AVDCRST_MAG49-3876, partial [uncultured Thermomicrobiales bacterium]